jgi:hypothetical protein
LISIILCQALAGLLTLKNTKSALKIYFLRAFLLSHLECAIRANLAD